MRIAAVLLLVLLSSCSKPQQEYPWQLPDGFPLPVVPADNPMSAAKVELGRHLFYDTALSANQQQSCASCHQQQYAFSQPLKVSVGSTGQSHRRNASALVNVAYNNTQTWAHDGLNHIETQLMLPLFGDSPVELGAGGHEQQILSRLQRAPYPQLFAAAFADSQPNFRRVIDALASFSRSLLSFNSRFDRYAYQQDDTSLTEQELQGLNLFFSEKLECHHCHGGFNFTQATSHQRQPLDRRPFHNTGLYYISRPDLAGMGYPQHDTGLSEVTLNPADDGRFRAPTLRNVAYSAPYMHDGSLATLEQVIDFYAAGGLVTTVNDQLSDGRQHPLKSSFVRGFALTAAEKQALLAFLHSLSDEQFITNPAYANPWLSERPH
ncbi:MAG: di-heme enzyme [Gammaproteobacteria bacterium]|nr:di-heme enzyme [Gammaproteobacteria bacterium]MBU1556417.1 di-heme enzyme [Gammaproteobacteria bacterium]MBU2071999.1 di-heme enzyme [Gammaproteobacteria bacterium]MBU2183916.1 di-heme enzyme [Gammaproteobacteria bacterium]MBU2203330.1 di-heme enzyme [Gammaproteobacteria bacterium]